MIVHVKRDILLKMKFWTLLFWETTCFNRLKNCDRNSNYSGQLLWDFLITFINFSETKNMFNMEIKNKQNPAATKKTTHRMELHSLSN